MKRETYARLMAFWRARPKALRAACMTNTVITRGIYVSYPCLLVWLAVQDGFPVAARALLVPLVGFVALTALRCAVNAQRPYEVFGEPSALHKDTRGKSFPSRHAFSIFIIGTAFLASPVPAALGATVLALGCVLAVVRVALGVHFPRDVLVGAVLGLLTGALGFAIV